MDGIMSNFLKIFWNVLLLTFLALGWKWADILYQAKILNDNERIWFLSIVTFILFLQTFYRQIPNPSNLKSIESRRIIIEQSLKDLTNKYYVSLGSFSNYSSNQPKPVIRVNLMLPTRKLKGLLGTYLRIYYYYCPDGIMYSEDEILNKWGKKDGTSGWAWSHKNMMGFYDSIRPELKLPANRIPKKNRLAVQDINSIISVPIRNDNEIVGVLNIDSKSNIDDTLFTNDKIYQLIYAYCSALGGHCFENGVEG